MTDESKADLNNILVMIQTYKNLFLNQEFRDSGEISFLVGSEPTWDFLKFGLDIDHGDDDVSLRVIIDRCSVTPNPGETAINPHGSATFGMDRYGALNVGLAMIGYSIAASEKEKNEKI